MKGDDINFESRPELELSGYLIFVKRYAGSKSERLFPKIIPLDGRDGIWVRHQDDDSFNHATLRPWHRQCVQVKGTKTQDGGFTIQEIIQAKDPAQPHE